MDGEVGRKVGEGGDVCIYTAVHFVGQQKLTQHCKAVILQFKKEDIM